jgi:hypothetical protein
VVFPLFPTMTNFSSGTNKEVAPSNEVM